MNLTHHKYHIEFPNSQFINYVKKLLPECILIQAQKMFQFKLREIICLKQYDVLHEKLQNSINNSKYSNTQRNISETSNQQSNHETFIYYIVYGEVQLQKYMPNDFSLKSNQSNRSNLSNNKSKQGRLLKEYQYFTLVDYKNMQIKQSIIALCKSNEAHIIRIPFKKNYDYNWYQKICEKSITISSIFINPQDYQNRYTIKFKELMNSFILKKYKRGAIIAKEGVPNQSLIIVKKGEIEFSKMLTLSKTNKNQLSNKQYKRINIAIAQTPTSISTEYFIMNNMQVYQIVNALAHQNNTFTVSSEPINNFTVTAYSSMVQTYQAPIEILQKELLNDWQKRLINKSSGFYITLLRKMDEVINRQLNHISQINQTSIHKTKRKLSINCTNYKQQSHSLDKQQYNLSKIDDHNQDDPQQENFITQNKKIVQNKINFLTNYQHKIPNYKLKIQDLLKKKIETHQNAKSQLKNQKQVQQAQQKFKYDIQKILMLDNAFRSQSIIRQSDIIDIKQNLLKKKYPNQDSQLIVDKDLYSSKNRVVRLNLMKQGVYFNDKQSLNYLRGISMDDYTTQIKKKYTQKINNVNKIKQQFMKIKSQCQFCHCYDNISGFYQLKKHHNHKLNTMRIGTGWKSNALLHKKQHSQKKQQPLEKAHSKVKFLSDKTKIKYDHNYHLHQKARKNSGIIQRKKSAPHFS